MCNLGSSHDYYLSYHHTSHYYYFYCYYYYYYFGCYHCIYNYYYYYCYYNYYNYYNNNNNYYYYYHYCHYICHYHYYYYHHYYCYCRHYEFFIGLYPSLPCLSFSTSLLFHLYHSHIRTHLPIFPTLTSSLFSLYLNFLLLPSLHRCTRCGLYIGDGQLLADDETEESKEIGNINKSKNDNHNSGHDNINQNTTQDDASLQPLSTAPPLLPSFCVADVKSIRFALNSVNIRTKISTHAGIYSMKNKLDRNSFSTDSEQVSESLFDLNLKETFC